MLRLAIRDPSGERTFATERSEILLGRREGVDLRILDRAASRNHCMLRIEGDVVRVVDLGTVNGTKVGGKKVTQATLGPGDEFSIGQTVIRISAFATPLSAVATAGLASSAAPAATSAAAPAPAPAPAPVKLALEPAPAPPHVVKAPVPTGGHGHDFAREVRDMMRRAPWYLTSLVVHVIALMVLDLIAATPRPLGLQHTLEAIAPADLARAEELDGEDVIPELEDVKPPEIEEEELLEEPDNEPETAKKKLPQESDFAPDEYRSPEVGLRGIHGMRLKKPLPVKSTLKGVDNTRVDRGDLAGEHEGVADIVRKSRARGGRGMPRGVPPDRILVVGGDFDKMENILDKYKIRHTFVQRDDLMKRKFPRAKLMCINCSRRPIAPQRRKLISIVKSFVQRGGWVITSDWALDPYLTQAFPDKIQLVEPTRHQPDTVVPVQAETATSPLLRGVFAQHLVTEWWLEETSTLFKVSPAVNVLIRSNQMQRRYGASPVVVEFRSGNGRVLHLLGHFYQKDGNRLGLVAMDNLILNYLVERFPTE